MAVLFDVMGTLLTLDAPVQRLRTAFADRGLAVSDEQARRALGAEIEVYKAGHLTGTDDASVEALRRRCADALAAELPGDVPAHDAYAALLEILRFTLLPGTRDALERLRAAGIRLAAVSNWDASLESTLAALGLRDGLDAVVTSAHVGVAKPDPAPLAAALERLGAGLDRAVMVGDEEVDVLAAAALGIPCVRVAPGAGIGRVADELLALPATP